ncbi:hypothetical protein C483_10811 [Natrialba hulunbeirensis JCM 10989]|uniref:Rhodopsin n=1 Tax=Natrialba hulunbeirensis JCM 10989 TaxID=1227493 RepID=L9ZVQ8_9EURY|nr:hypothetical protein C483_10811 [Natrialba hulunbeirensis JCM 10989]
MMSPLLLLYILLFIFLFLIIRREYARGSDKYEICGWVMVAGSFFFLFVTTTDMHVPILSRVQEVTVYGLIAIQGVAAWMFLWLSNTSKF